MCCVVVVEKFDVIVVYCINFRGVGVVEIIEVEIGIFVFDSVLMVFWKLMCVVGVDLSWI